MSSPFKPESETEGTGAAPTAQESVQPAEAEEAAPVEAPPVGETAEAEQPPAPAEGEPQSSEAEETPSVRAQARKVFMDVQKMGGQPAFEVARTMLDSFVNGEATDFIAEVSKYPGRFIPVRDQILTDAVRQYPEALASMLKEAHPDLEVQVGRKAAETKAPVQAPGEDSVAYARRLLVWDAATEEDKALARAHIADSEELAAARARLEKLPELEEKVTRFDEFTTQSRQERVEAEQGRYTADLLTNVVDKTYKEAGLESGPISLDQFRQLVILEHGNNPAAFARLKQALDAIAAGDPNTANLLKEQIMRDAEPIAFKYAKSFSGAAAVAARHKSSELTRERPKVVPDRAAAAVASPAGDVDYAAALADIKARVG